MSKIEVAYQPKILKTLLEICVEMGVGRETVLSWIDKGAPIAIDTVEGRPRYSCEAAALQNWRLQNGKRN